MKMSKFLKRIRLPDSIIYYIIQGCLLIIIFINTIIERGFFWINTWSLIFGLFFLGIALGLHIEDVNRSKEYLKKLREEEKALSSDEFSVEAKNSTQKGSENRLWRYYSLSFRAAMKPVWLQRYTMLKVNIYDDLYIDFAGIDM